MTCIVARVESQKGSCEAGHRIGDEFIIDPARTPAGMCPWAFYTLFPFAEDPARTRVACPDPDNPVVFELRRMDE